jgi:hypothetical protein
MLTDLDNRLAAARRVLAARHPGCRPLQPGDPVLMLCGRLLTGTIAAIDGNRVSVLAEGAFRVADGDSCLRRHPTDRRPLSSRPGAAA